MLVTFRKCPRCGYLTAGSTCPFDGNETLPHDVPYRRHLTPGTVLWGRFVVSAFVEDDGWMAVHEGRDVKLHRPARVVVIPVPDETPPADREDMLRSARALELLDHPGIAKVLASGMTEQGDLAIVGPHIAGQSLAELLLLGPFGFDRVVELGINVFSALEAAHAAGIAHHDLAPSRIRIQSDGWAVVTDLGLADILHRPNMHAPEHPTLARGARYRAPELLDDRAVTRHADIYSVGAIMSEALTGRKLVAAGPNPESLTQLPVEQPIARFLARCLEPKPWHRFDTAAQARGVLEAIREKANLASADGNTRMSGLAWDTPRAEANSREMTLPGAQPDSGILALNPAAPTDVRHLDEVAGAPVDAAPEPPIAHTVGQRRDPTRWWWLAGAVIVVVVAAFALSRPGGATLKDTTRVSASDTVEREVVAGTRTPSATRTTLAPEEEARALTAREAEAARAKAEAEARAAGTTTPVVGPPKTPIAEPSTAPVAESSTPPAPEPGKYRARLVTNPAGASVLTQGTLIGKSPLTLDWSEGDKTSLLIVLTGYEPATLVLSTKQNGVLLHFDLKPVQPAPTP